MAATTSKAARDRNEAIRAWGLANGWELSDRGPIPAQLRSEYETYRSGAPVEEVTADSAGAYIIGLPHAGPGGSPDTAPDHDAPAGTGHPDPSLIEQPPEPPKQSAFRKISAALSGASARKPPKGDGARKKTPRKTARARISLEPYAAPLWSVATGIIARIGRERFAPLAAMMAFEQPFAGMVMDQSIEGTPLDRPCQWAAGLAQSANEGLTLFIPPFVVAGYCMGYIPYPAARFALEVSLKNLIIIAGPKIREAQEREEQFAQEMAQMTMPGPDGEPVPVSLDQIIGFIFSGAAPPEGEPNASANGQYPAGATAG